MGIKIPLVLVIPPYTIPSTLYPGLQSPNYFNSPLLVFFFIISRLEATELMVLLSFPCLSFEE